MSNPFSSIQNLLQRIFSPKIVSENGEYVVQYDLININRINTSAAGAFTASGATMTIADTRVTTVGVILISVNSGQSAITQAPFVSGATAGVGFTVAGLTSGVRYSYVLIN